MTDLRDAARQALELLKELQGGCTDSDDGTVEALTVWCPEVIAELEAAFAQPEPIISPEIKGDKTQPERKPLAEMVQEPVASVTECEACFTPDVCQLRGTCDHYAAERLRVAAPPQREPVHQWRKQMCADWYDGHPDHSDGGGPYETRVLYSAPPQRKPLAEMVQEPVAWMDIDSDGQRLAVRQWSDGNRDEVPLYTAPPQRKPLTERELKVMWAEYAPNIGGIFEFARAIERAHGIGV